METAPKKGMSKGCLVSLIVVSAILLIIIVGMLICWRYQKDIVKQGGVMIVNSAKKEVAENPPAELDTAQFNAVCDGFVAKVKADTALDMQGVGLLMQNFGEMIRDKEVSLDDANSMMESMTKFYPELSQYMQPTQTTEEIQGDSSDVAADSL